MDVAMEESMVTLCFHGTTMEFPSRRRDIIFLDYSVSF